MRLSAVLIAKDEEAVLGRCLASLKGVVDEVVLLDTGSTDRTTTVAWEHGARVFEGEWRDDFAAARNEALDCAKGEWILWIDADEELVASAAQVRAMMDAGHHAYETEIENFVDERADGNRFVHSAPRLFRRGPETRWEGRVHEQVVGMTGTKVRVEGAFIRHHGYRPSIMEAKDKAARTIRLLNEELKENPDDSFQLFNLANALIVAGRPAEAYPHAVRSTELMPKEAAYAAFVWHLRVQSAPAPIAEADLADRAGWGGKFVDFERAQAYLRRGEALPALRSIDRSLAAPWPKDSPGDSGIGYKSRLIRAQALLGMNRDREALADVEEALPHDPHLGLARRLRAEARRRLGLPHAEDLRLAWAAAPDETGLWVAWTQACEAENDVQGLVEAHEAYAALHDPSPGILVNWARALEADGQADKALALFEEAVRRAPDDANACLNCADALGRRGMWADAAHLYGNALRSVPGDPQAWFTLGNAYAHAGFPDAALRAYDRCLSIQPSHGPAAHNREIVDEGRRAA